jgi:4-hydroxyphenylpyruvate dioxygenase
LALRTSIATVSLSGDLVEKLEAIAAAGFDGVEIFENDFLASDHSPADVGAMVVDAGLAITLFQPFRDFEGMPEPERARAFDRAERKFDVMQALGVDLMLVCSNVSPVAMGGTDRAADDLRHLGERASARGLRIGYEALAWGRFVSDHRDAWEIVRRADHQGVGLILDSFHTLARGIDTDSIRRIPADRLFLVQVADAPKLHLDLLTWSRHFRNMPGQGDLDVLGFAEAVHATGYDGYWSLEIFNDQFRAGSARAVAVDGRRSLIALGDRAGIGGAKLPPRARCNGVAFIEFAADDASAVEIETMFRALGFPRRGRHRSKDVTVWRQGEINLVVNREREGFAHSFFLTHGPAVCAIGLQVDNARAAAARAKALLSTPFRQAVGAGELDIPAIRSVGGSLIYFLDEGSELANVWAVEFDWSDEPETETPSLIAIDHISQSMDYDEMLSAALFYTSILDVEKSAGLDIADPGGLVRSQVVQNRDGSFRIALNGSQSQRTLSGRFINEFFGSGVQHIAFCTDDIGRAARTLRDAGLESLPIPANYYDDLQAKFGLSDAERTNLSALGILYDRDPRGEYFQLYTPTLFDRYFFEIVERRGYTGFGAPNAPIRLAAQARFAKRIDL